MWGTGYYENFIIVEYFLHLSLPHNPRNPCFLLQPLHTLLVFSGFSGTMGFLWVFPYRIIAILSVVIKIYSHVIFSPIVLNNAANISIKEQTR